MWASWEKLSVETKEKLHGPIIGKWHYSYENKHGKIGLIKLNHNLNFHKGKIWNHCWETCGNFELTRYPTKQEAEAAIFEKLHSTKQ